MVKNSKKAYDIWRGLVDNEKNFFLVCFIYSCGISLLSLAIPISTQALVNSVTFAVLLQPLIVVSLILLVLLILSGFLNGLQDHAVEFFQRHFYVRSTYRIADKILTANKRSMQEVNGHDLINRYFDIMTVQKSGTKLMVGGFSLLLQTIVGLILLAFYHPYFLAFDILLVFLLYMVWALYGKKAMESSIVESKAKYKVSSWLEQLVMSNSFFKAESNALAAANRVDSLVSLYLEKRKIHFSYLFRQIIFLLAIYAILSALMLGLGGFLVISGQLTLGQLVAAEIVVAVILSGFAKAGEYLESFYDMHAALDKLGDFDVLKEEEHHELSKIEFNAPALTFDNVELKVINRTYHLNFNFKPKTITFLEEDVDSTQRAFLSLVKREVEAERGAFKLGDTIVDDIPQSYFRDRVYTIDSLNIIEGTLFENLTWGLSNTPLAKVNEMVDIVGLKGLVDSLPDGLDTKIWPNSSLLCWGNIMRLEIARALLKNPDWLIISSLFIEIPVAFRVKILKDLKDRGISTIVWSSGASGLPDMEGEISVHKFSNGEE